MKNTSTELTEMQQPNKFKLLIEKIGKRNIIIACAVVLIGAAVWMNWLLFAGNDKGGYDGYDQPSGSISDDLQNGDNADNVNSDNAYFSATQVSRQRARDEALEVLQSVVSIIALFMQNAPVFQGNEVLCKLMWWALALAVCLGGNGSLVGAAANLVTVGLAEKAGYKLSFKDFMRYGIPVTLGSMIFASIYIVGRYAVQIGL